MFSSKKDNVTPFMRKKWSRVFDMKDFRGVGKVEEQDFVAWGRKAAKNAGVEYTADLEQAWRSVHQAYFGENVTKEAWIQHMANFVSSNPDNGVEISAELNKKIMKVVDTNGDGVVSWKEFWCWIEPLGVTEEEGKSAFEICDINGDGSLDLKEFGTACARYYFDPDMSEFANFYGAYNATVTPFMRKKWSRVFDMKDFRGVGKVEEQDFVAWGRKAAKNAGVEYTADLEQAWRSVHQAYFGENVTKEAWIQHMANFVSSNPDNGVEISAELNKKIMKVVDTNGDGVVSWKEFWCWIEPLGVTEEEGKSSFEICDINGDGSLDLKEFGTACARYYFDPDMSEFANFYGAYNATVTPFMRKKWSRVFDMKDFRGVGKVEEQDFVAWGRKAAKNAGVEYTADLEQAWRSVHQAYFGENVTKEAWIQHMANFVSSNPDNGVEISAELNKKIMKVVDTNGDGVVSWKEFWCWIEPLGVTEEEGKNAFETCDINGDGSLDLKEFGTACARYYFDPDMSEFANFYGAYNATVTPFMRKKWSRVFDMKDFRGVGKVEEQDFVAWGRKAAKNAGVEYTADLEQAWRSVHQAYFGENVTKEAWIQHMANFVSSNPDNGVEISAELNKKIMKVVDTNGDGVVSWKEFWCWIEPLGVTEEEGKNAFETCDINGDGTLDLKEFGTACARYYFDPDMSEFANFYGPFHDDISFPEVSKDTDEEYDVPRIYWFCCAKK